MYGNQVCKEICHSFYAAIAALVQHCLRSALGNGLIELPSTT
ncbi:MULTISPECIES: hypothetical protein [Vibrio]|nr:MULTISPECIES: hypothetical protein [Vibrio]MDF4682514.1 hypothetical protein [Vibrio parahaemolyticus]